MKWVMMVMVMTAVLTHQGCSRWFTSIHSLGTQTLSVPCRSIGQMTKSGPRGPSPLAEFPQGLSGRAGARAQGSGRRCWLSPAALGPSIPPYLSVFRSSENAPPKNKKIQISLGPSCFHADFLSLSRHLTFGSPRKQPLRRGIGARGLSDR